MNRPVVFKKPISLLPFGAVMCFVAASIVLYVFPSLKSLICFFGFGITSFLTCAFVKTNPSWRYAIFAASGLIMVCTVPYVIRPKFHSGPSYNPQRDARIQIENFGNALDQFEIDNGSYPHGKNGLQALIQKPTYATNWRGPYLMVNAIPLDPWKHPYIYTFPGTRAASGFPYDLISLGQPGANAPITNDGRNDF
jgi:general secretion pathway protein G